MASPKENYALRWNGHADNFSNSLNDLLQQNEMVDVTLAADGYLFSAHRLVLSALSPYFRRMFTQMPANQQAFVFMKDVSKQTVEDLIKFIYAGEVNVGQDGLEEFLNTARALEIKCIAGENTTPSFNVEASESKWSMPPQTGFQYQSSRSVRVPNSVNSNSTLSLSLYHQATEEHQELDYFDTGDVNETTETEHKMGSSSHNYSYNYELNGKFLSTDQKSICQNNPWDSNHPENGTEMIKPKVKRVQASDDYNIVANIRQNASGRDNLFHSGYKFARGHKAVKRQGWQCTRSHSGGCKAYISTMNVNGVNMMKVLKADHTHAP